MSSIVQKNIYSYQDKSIAWWIVSVFIFFNALWILIGVDEIFKLTYPFLALVSGILLYRLFPPFYIGFTWWIWFSTPFIRRVVDYQLGWDRLNLIVITPLLVTMVTIFTLARNSQILFRRALRPFTMILVAILYCYFVGVIKNGFLKASYGLIVWITPIFFAMHLVLNWREYPYYRNVIQRVFLWGVMIMGLYGIAQFISPSGWDKYWISNAQMGSVGLPEPFRVRIFSTLNSPGPFANAMATGLIILFSSKGLLRILGAIPGYVSLLLSIVRSVWGSWVVAIMFIALKAGGRLRLRLLVFSIVIGLGVLPAVSFGPMAERINERFQSLGNIEEDSSFNTRLALYREYLGSVFFNIAGAGLGYGGVSVKLDSEEGESNVIGFESGIMHLPFVLGWVGTFFYLFGLVLLISATFSGRYFRLEFFAITAQAIVLANLSLLMVGNALVGLSGMIFWSFLGLVLAASKYSESNISSIQ